MKPCSSIPSMVDSMAVSLSSVLRFTNCIQTEVRGQRSEVIGMEYATLKFSIYTVCVCVCVCEGWGVCVCVCVRGGGCVCVCV